MSAAPRKAAENACSMLSADSLKCIETFYEDKGKCAGHFERYRACKKKAYEDAREARIRARDGSK